MPKIVALKKNEDKRILNGHLWVFSNEIAKTEGDPLPGDIVTLRNHGGHTLGIGFYHPHSLIAVRLLARKQVEIDFQFFLKRIESAATLRKKIYPTSEFYRLVHGEGDFLPGLIIDKYNDYLCVQTFSFGMDSRLTLICDVLESLFHPKAIIERNESPTRALEGLEQKKGILRGSVDTVTVKEYGVTYSVDLLNGQKTGLFLDQRESRKAFRRYATGGRVLDCFCNDGGFALHAAYAGASEVTGIDSSETAIRHAVANANDNKLAGRLSFLNTDAFEFLKKSADEHQQYDAVNLDPPSFTKNKRSVVAAKQGYKELHTSALHILKPGGILATASCSYHITEETFLDIVDECARKAERPLHLLEWHGAAPDHPVLPSMPETRYLKFGIFQVL